MLERAEDPRGLIAKHDGVDMALPTDRQARPSLRAGDGSAFVARWVALDPAGAGRWR